MNVTELSIEDCEKLDGGLCTDIVIWAGGALGTLAGGAWGGVIGSGIGVLLSDGICNGTPTGAMPTYEEEMNMD